METQLSIWAEDNHNDLTELRSLDDVRHDIHQLTETDTFLSEITTYLKHFAHVLREA